MRYKYSLAVRADVFDENDELVREAAILKK